MVQDAQTQVEQWITNEKACEILGLQLRAFQRKVQHGLIRREIDKSDPKKRRLYSLEDVMNVKERMAAGTITGSALAAAPTIPGSNQIVPMITQQAAHAAFEEQYQFLNRLVRAQQADKPWLTLQEASDYSGLPVHWLRKKCKECSLGINVAGARKPRWMIKKIDLTESI